MEIQIEISAALLRAGRFRIYGFMDGTRPVPSSSRRENHVLGILRKLACEAGISIKVVPQLPQDYVQLLCQTDDIECCAIRDRPQYALAERTQTLKPPSTKRQPTVTVKLRNGILTDEHVPNGKCEKAVS